MSQKLAVIRGPSGAGKTTVLSLLSEDSPFVILSVDTIVDSFTSDEDLTPELVYGTLLDIVRTHIRKGLNVIVEGILSTFYDHLDMEFQLFGVEYIKLFLDVNFELGLERNLTGGFDMTRFDEEQQRIWYETLICSVRDDEIRIDASNKPEVILQHILNAI